ncbi:hypothetical protein RFI_23561 [Reticulomyxa filosa]|uniref:Uncharacterized protein n=1 Tax=Reticulomyxa filosa TaxID=46433 RepID=X6MIV7_RETFI|nr:hypothetical protein RFI_23561 [Reticulomyxa filosa]|eukprot:ETO13809.1 hypothetical protein RFI_23561 [Reticulomyxa filosa]
MQHLQKERAIENLLALVEFRQCLGLIVLTPEYNELESSQRERFKAYSGIAFASNVPMSGICREPKWFVTTKLRLLYFKYITNNAQLQINLSFALKKRWDAVFLQTTKTDTDSKTDEAQKTNNPVTTSESKNLQPTSIPLRTDEKKTKPVEKEFRDIYIQRSRTEDHFTLEEKGIEVMSILVMDTLDTLVQLLQQSVQRWTETSQFDTVKNALMIGHIKGD